MPSNRSCSVIINERRSHFYRYSLDVARKCLAQQLEELEIISSIFCGPRELVIDDPGIIVDLHSFIGGEETFLNQKLDYRIQVSLTGLNKKMEVFFELPHYYPALELPTVTVSYPNISTNQHNSLKALVEDALQSLQKPEETFLYAFISWIQDDEQVRKVLLNTEAPPIKPQKINTTVDASEEKLERLWIYSHHIKSKRKRASIIENAQRLQLTGFSLPGKPGIICVEGHQSDTQEFFRIIKSMHWQRIQLRLEETGESIQELATFRRFNKFDEEARFVVANDTAGDNDNDDDDEIGEQNNQNYNQPGEDNGEVLRLNMGTFRAYLEQHQCGYVMASLFGFK